MHCSEPQRVGRAALGVLVQGKYQELRLSFGHSSGHLQIRVWTQVKPLLAATLSQAQLNSAE